MCAIDDLYFMEHDSSSKSLDPLGMKCMLPSLFVGDESGDDESDLDICLNAAPSIS